jgi:hypothetical protein
VLLEIPDNDLLFSDGAPAGTGLVKGDRSVGRDGNIAGLLFATAAEKGTFRAFSDDFDHF